MAKEVIKDPQQLLDEVVDPWLERAGNSGLLFRHDPFVQETIDRFDIPTDIGDGERDRWTLAAHHLPIDQLEEVRRMGGVLGQQSVETLYLDYDVRRQICRRMNLDFRILGGDALLVFAAPWIIADSSLSLDLSEHRFGTAFEDLPPYYVDKTRKEFRGHGIEVTDDKILEITRILPIEYQVGEICIEP